MNYQAQYLKAALFP